MSYFPNSSTNASSIVGDTNTYTHFTPLDATVKGALRGIDSALASVGTGTVGSFSFTNMNGFIGTVDNPTSTPNLTLGISVSGLLKGSSAAIVAATSADLPISVNGGADPLAWNSSTGVLSMPAATGSQNGYLASADWTTFSAKQNALAFGNLTDSTAGTDGITVTNGTGAVIGSGTSIAQQASSGSANGYLASSDWTTFNNKANSSLNNLTSTSINQSLVPASAGSQVLGSAANYWGTSYISQLFDSAGFKSIDVFSRLLADSTGTTQLTWSTAGISLSGALNMNSNQITNLPNPTTNGEALRYDQLGAPTSGSAIGIATLDASGKIPLGQLPSSVMEYQSRWNPTTNTPTLSDGTGTNGYVYWVSAAFAGPVSGLNDPSMVNFQIGDLVIYSSAVGAYQLTTPAAGVSSVNGAQGAVTVNAISQLTGDATAGPASGSQSQALTLATVNVNTGTFGSSTSIPTFTVNAKGLITAASGSAVIAPAGTLSGTTLNATVVSSSLTSVGVLTGGTWNATTIAIGFGGTGVTSATTTPTASAFAAWDTNTNFFANNFVEGYTSTATSATTTTLTAASTYEQFFTGSTTQTVLLPVTSTLALGWQYMIVNRSSGTVTVQSSGGNTIQAMAANTQLLVTVVLTSGTTAASWDAVYASNALPISTITLTGDVTGTGSGSIGTTIASNAVTNAKLAQMGASTIKGNNTGGTANAADLSASQVLTMLGTRAGSVSLSSSATSGSVTFSSAFPNTSYAISVSLVNTTDTNPQFQPITITAQSTTGFSFKLNDPTDTANYSVQYIAIGNN